MPKKKKKANKTLSRSKASRVPRGRSAKRGTGLTQIGGIGGIGGGGRGGRGGP